MKEHKVRVSSKGQVVIPQEIRKEYGISAGTELTLRPLDENSLVFEKVPKLSEFLACLDGPRQGTCSKEKGRKKKKLSAKGMKNYDEP